MFFSCQLIVFLLNEKGDPQTELMFISLVTCREKNHSTTTIISR